MRYRKLGRTGLAVSEICLGAMTFGGDGFWKVIGALEQEPVTKLVRSAFDKGVTFIDTADVYSNGMSEQVTGEAIKGLPRDELVIATKVSGAYRASTSSTRWMRVCSGCRSITSISIKCTPSIR
jgi:aryl-alcohol dehydrogenase-like predicted oxidoreductase